MVGIRLNTPFNGALANNLTFSPDNTYDIGASGATRPRNLFMSGAATVGDYLLVGNFVSVAGNVASTGGAFVLGAGSDLTITRSAAASLLLGAAASASPVSYTLTGGESSRAGTDSNTAGGSFTIASGQGSGTGAVSSIVFKTPTVAASGSGAQSLATRLTLSSAGMTASAHLLFSADNTYDIGALGATRPSSLYLGNSLTVEGSVSLAHGNEAAYLAWGINSDVQVGRDAADILTLRRGTNGQTFRIYGTLTGSKYLSLAHNGTNAVISTTAGNIVVSQALDLSGISAGSPNLVVTATSDTPSTTYTAHVASTDPAGYIEITVGASSRYIPFFT